MQSWLWAAPAKHSTRQIDRVLERTELLTSLKVDQHLAELPEAIVRRYARRLAGRTPSVAARTAEPTRTIEVACFLPPGLIGRIATTRTEGINLRGVFTFPIEQYQAQLLPSLLTAKSRAFGG